MFIYIYICIIYKHAIHCIPGASGVRSLGRKLRISIQCHTGKPVAYAMSSSWEELNAQGVPLLFGSEYAWSIHLFPHES